MNNLDRIDAYCNAAMDGPWSVDATEDYGDAFVRDVTGDSICCCVIESRDEANANFIAFARADLPALVTECRILRKLLAEVASSGVAYSASKYVEVQIGNETWGQLQKLKERHDA